jgi:N-acetylmuramate 1-kinase
MTSLPLVWADPARASAFAQWLAAVARQHDLRIDSVRLASADASFRRYLRIDAAAGAGSFVIMDAPPALEDCAPFVKVAGLMLDAGLSAPRVLAWDAPLGFMLLSDLGAQTMLDVISPPAATLAVAEPTPAHFDLYMEAVDVLVRWQLASRPGVLPPYDDALLSRELALFPEWYVGRYRGFALEAKLMDRLAPIFAQIKASNLESLGGARVYVHRDFMPRNLMVHIAPTLVASRTTLPPEGALRLRPGEAGSAAPAEKIGDTHRSSLGVLDFQDAVYGPITYDIASLMRDAFLSWEEEFVLDITVRYWQKARKAGLPVGDDFGEFYRAVEWMGLQRHLKVLGIFARLTLRDGKPGYLADTPRFIKYARATCARYRQLGPLMVLLDEIEGNETRVGYTF